MRYESLPTESKQSELTHYLFGFFPLLQEQPQVHLSNIPRQISEEWPSMILSSEQLQD